MKQRYTIIVDGIPKTKGSMKYVGKKRGKAVLTSTCKGLKAWEKKIAAEANKQEIQLLTNVKLDLEFCLPRPKNHYRANGEVKPRFLMMLHTTKPDLDKLVRAATDALQGIAYKDDSVVWTGERKKLYAHKPGDEGVIIRIEGEKA